MSDDFDELTREDLRDLARDAGLPVSGTKADLIGRLRAFEAENPVESADETPEGAVKEAPEAAESHETAPEAAPEAPAARNPRGPGLRQSRPNDVIARVEDVTKRRAESDRRFVRIEPCPLLRHCECVLHAIGEQPDPPHPPTTPLAEVLA